MQLTKEDGSEVTFIKHEYLVENQFYVGSLSQQLIKDDIVTISMDFTGLLNDQMAGFYRSSFVDELDNKR